MRPFVLFGTGCDRLSGQAVSLHPGRHVFGRHPDWADIVLGSPFVSRKHFVLDVTEDSCYMTDLQSKHGTYVNDEAVAPFARIELKGDCMLTLADSLVQMSFSRRSIVELLDQEWPFTDGTSAAGSLLPPPIILNRQFITLTKQENRLLQYLLANEESPVDLHKVRTAVWSVGTMHEQENTLAGDEDVRKLVSKLLAKASENVRVQPIRQMNSRSSREE